jgi:hypothetical protein
MRGGGCLQNEQPDRGRKPFRLGPIWVQFSRWAWVNTVPWRSVHPQTDHVTFRPKLSVHPTNRLLWQFTTVTNVHLYDPSTYFSSTLPSRWTVCHLWHNIHPSQNALWHHVHPFLKQNLDGLSQHFGTHLWPPAGCLATCGRFVTGLFPYTFAMSSRLFSQVWMFCRLIFGHLWCPARLLSKLWMFCHRICKKRKKSHEAVPLRIRCNTWKWAEIGEFSWIMDLLSRMDEMSQQSWTKKRLSFGHLWCPAHLLSKLWTFCHRIYVKSRNLMRQSF